MGTSILNEFWYRISGAENFIFCKLIQNFTLILEYTPHFLKNLKKSWKHEFTPHFPPKGLSFHHFCVLPPLEIDDFENLWYWGHQFWTNFGTGWAGAGTFSRALRSNGNKAYSKDRMRKIRTALKQQLTTFEWACAKASYEPRSNNIVLHSNGCVRKLFTIHVPTTMPVVSIMLIVSSEFSTVALYQHQVQELSKRFQTQITGR